MSAISAPAPISIGITSIADRQQRPRTPQRKIAPKASRFTSNANATEASSHNSASPAFDGMDDDVGLPADTLFTAALLANQMPYRTETPDEVMVRMNHVWVPPDSEFQLTDKTI